MVAPPPPFAIGDLQGCCDALQRLLARIDTAALAGTDAPAAADGNPPGATGAAAAALPRLWFAGDLVNRGPASLATLRRIIELGERAIPILGNHDLHLLAVAAGVRELKRGDTLTDILQAKDADDLLDWVRHQRLAHFDNGMLMVHAGVLPQWDVALTLEMAADIERGLRGADWRKFVAKLFGSELARWTPTLQPDERLRIAASALTRLRFCTPDGLMDFKANGAPASAPFGFMPWFDVPGRRTADTTVVFGHWAANGLMPERSDVCALDSGCVWGNRLTAIRLDPDPARRTITQVDCAAAR